MWEKLIMEETACTIEVSIAFAGIVSFGIACGQVFIVIVDAVSAQHRIQRIFRIGQRRGFQFGRPGTGFYQIDVFAKVW